ncbi:MAG: AAA family ATPase [Firmicutes bacterium]|nr:AAA family ATPase [Bacillota bacterium]
MFNVCPECGQYPDNKAIEPNGPFALCHYCGYRHRFKQLPLFVITGPSGIGKSTLCLELSTRTSDYVIMETDILWNDEFTKGQDNYVTYHIMWLPVAKNISQAGKPVILCGTALPEQHEQCAERRYFDKIHYLALVCEDETLANRLQNRPSWRRSGEKNFIDEMIPFNRWFKDNANRTKPPIELLDTTGRSIDCTTEQIIKWLDKHNH